MYICIDESGSITNSCNYFKNNYFFLSLILTRDIKLFNVNVRRCSTTTSLLKKHIKENQELKGSGLKEKEKQPFLKKILNKGDFQICLVKVDNRRLYPYMKNDPARTFNYILKNVIVALKNKNIISNDEKIEFYIDNRNIKVESRNELEGYLIASLWENSMKNPIIVHYVDSRNNYGVQCADVIVNTYRRYTISHKIGDTTEENMKMLKRKVVLDFKFPI